MGKSLLRALLWGLGVGLYLRYGLEPTGWLFYEASHATGIDWLYWGYSAFRGGAHLFGLWAYQVLACAVAGLLVGLIVWRRARRREVR
jgi:apolipoprotein N-acyltransferase